MTVVDLKTYKIRKKRDHINHIRETILKISGHYFTNDEIYDIYEAAVFVSELSKEEK